MPTAHQTDPDFPDTTDLLRTCELAVRAGGQELQDWAGKFAVREKGPADLVTEADLASQEAIRAILLGRFPTHQFLAEEGDHARGSGIAATGFRWIVDPLDGTTNYVHGLPQYCVSIGLEHRGELLVGACYDPVADECFTAVRGGGAFLNGNKLKVSTTTHPGQALVAVSFPPRIQRDARELADFLEVLFVAQAVRRMGSSALNLCYVAAGRFDAYWASDTKAWDIAAGVLLVQEAGGVLTHLDGGPFDLTRPRLIAAGTAALHGELLRILKRA